MIQIVGNSSRSILRTSFFSSSGVQDSPVLPSCISTVSLCSFSAVIFENGCFGLQAGGYDK